GVVTVRRSPIRDGQPRPRRRVESVLAAAEFLEVRVAADALEQPAVVAAAVGDGLYAAGDVELDPAGLPRCHGLGVVVHRHVVTECSGARPGPRQAGGPL